MAPKKAGTRTKRGSLAQPVLSFQTRKPSAGGKKPILQSTSTSTSAASIRRTDSETSIKSTEAESPTQAQSRSTEVLGTKADNAHPNTKRERKQLDVKSKEWRGLKKHAEAEMGNLAPIHAGPETHNDVHHILRVFDLTASYGPCVGITRLERWERAKKWGLNPPEEIKAILTTQQGEDQQEYRENVLYTWLG